VECNLLINLNKGTNIYIFYMKLIKNRCKSYDDGFVDMFDKQKFYDDGFVDSRIFKSLEITIFLGL